jgi:hypothetical protein
MKLPNQSFWKLFKDTHGALSTTESIAIFNIAHQAPEGIYLELGTFRGKSAMSAASGFKKGVFHLVDPIFADPKTARTVEGIVRDVSDKQVKAITVNAYSTDVIPRYNNLSYVFVDSGCHNNGLPMQEVKLLENRIVKDGIIAFHDYGNEFTEVADAYDYLLGTGKYEAIVINWDQIFDYVRENNLELNNNSWHQRGSEEFPKFVGALRRK